MKKTLPLLIASAILAQQAFAAPKAFKYYGYSQTPNSYGTITATLSGECTGSATYNINDVSVALSLPQEKLSYYTGIQLGFKSDLGNFEINHTSQNQKDKITFEEGAAIKVNAQSKERSTLFHLWASHSNSNYDNFFELITAEGDSEMSRVTYHDLYKRLSDDNNFVGDCGSQTFKQKFPSIELNLNSPSAKVSSTAAYSSTLNSSNITVTTSTKLNTSFSAPLKQNASSQCVTNAPLTADATSYSFSCTAPKPVVLTVTIAIDATETLDASEM